MVPPALNPRTIGRPRRLNRETGGSENAPAAHVDLDAARPPLPAGEFLPVPHVEPGIKQPPAAFEPPSVFDVPLPPPPVPIEAPRTSPADSQPAEVEASDDQTLQVRPAMDEHASEAAEVGEAELRSGPASGNGGRARG